MTRDRMAACAAVVLVCVGATALPAQAAEEFVDFYVLKYTDASGTIHGVIVEEKVLATADGKHVYKYIVMTGSANPGDWGVDVIGLGHPIVEFGYDAPLAGGAITVIGTGPLNTWNISGESGTTPQPVWDTLDDATTALPDGQNAANYNYVSAAEPHSLYSAHVTGWIDDGDGVIETADDTFVLATGEISGPTGEEPPRPGLELTKTASVASALFGDLVTYTYTVKNTGGTTLTDVTVIDDNGTPGYEDDDVLVGTVASLAPGEKAVFELTIMAAGSLCGDDKKLGPIEAGSLAVTQLPSGDIQVTFIQSLGVKDNTYGANATPGYGKKGQQFKNLVGSDKAQFQFTDAAGNVVLDFYVDCISPSALPEHPSGYGTLGVAGDEGQMLTGSADDVLSWSTSISTNLNERGLVYTVDSPAPPSAEPTWEYRNIYSVIVNGAAFAGLGGVTIPYVHNSPRLSKPRNPKPCESDVTNTATATATAGDITVTATAEETIHVVGNESSSDEGEKGKKPKKKPKH